MSDDKIRRDMAGLKLAQEISNGNNTQRDSNATQKEALQDEGGQQAADQINPRAADAGVHDRGDFDDDINGDGDGNGDFDDGVQYPRVQWDSLLRLISQRVDDVTETGAVAGTKNDPNIPSNIEVDTLSLDDHDRHYRAAFERIREEVAARNDIPDAVATAPGLSTLRLTFVPASLAGRCPCCLGDYDFPSLIICATTSGGSAREGEDGDTQHMETQGGEGGIGVTKDMLIQGIRDGLYPGPDRVDDPETAPDKLEGGSEELVELEPKPKLQSVPSSAAGDDPHTDLDQEAGDSLDSNTGNGGGGGSNTKITLANFAWMNGDCGLLDDTLYVYYGSPDDDDSSSTKSELLKVGEVDKGGRQQEDQEEKMRYGGGGGETEKDGEGRDGARHE
ncbi:hypothetical protein SLS62_010838 [Diatrype stigma]|uniref:Uncharacterized protein n=1 Tax=Diatrype stigma TaxID=117547 RepID=A0AAN9U6R3_9PEZI